MMIEYNAVGICFACSVWGVKQLLSVQLHVSWLRRFHQAKDVFLEAEVKDAILPLGCET